jgi:hypothetical protein
MANRLLPAHQIVCQQIKLELLAALACDVGRTSFPPYVSIHEELSQVYPETSSVLTEVDKSLSIFNSILHRVRLNHLRSKLAAFPFVSKILQKRGFLIDQKTKEPYRNKPAASRSAHNARRYPYYYAIGPRIGLSYGTPWHLFAPIHLSCLTALTSLVKIQIYRPDISLMAASDMVRLFECFEAVEVIDANKHRFTWQELHMFYDSECLINCYDAALYDLYDKYAIPSDRAFTQSDFLNYSPHMLTRLTSAVVRRRLLTKHEASGYPYISMIKQTSRPIIALSNRDPVWAGTGQPWRDIPIAELEGVIHILIQQGYFVVRINTVGEPSRVKSRHFLDLATVDIDAYSQLFIYSKCSMVIGGVSGVADWPRTFSLLPTLYLNSPVLSVSNGIYTGLSVVSLQSLRVADKEIFYRTPIHALVEQLFDCMWSPECLGALGMSSERCKPSEYLSEVSEFLSSIATARPYRTTADLCEKFGLSLPSRLVPQPITNASFDLLSNLLSKRLGHEGSGY